ncbi:MAG: gamma-glutamylcyclotransferase family protein [Candidatus Lernaella stagnicola]|nr:gamma-glutamylcyclotransferase family protein [Candidatus Lernaella stagnicola]
MERTLYQPHYDARLNALVFLTRNDEDRDMLRTARRVFVCGSLQNPSRMAEVVGRPLSFATCFVTGFAHRTLSVGDRLVPFMLATPNDRQHTLPGVLYLGLTEKELRKIMDVELGDGHRKRVEVQVRVGSHSLEATTFIKK